MMNKADTRKAMLAQRKAAHASEREGTLKPMVLWLKSQLKPGDTLGTYNPIRTERDPGPLHADVSEALAFPRVMGTDQPLDFFAVSSEDDFEAGFFDVLEPRPTLPRVVPDIILVPLVGFDRAGFRLGYGGGFYDRTLAKFRTLKPTLAVGFAYDAQLSEQALNFEETDLALDAVITPTRRYDFTGGTCQEFPWS